ncbi:DUF2256 domain-containing protein [Thalassospira povalilytica]|uniref:DUF2256 domain-containing protein n=1 Tax=Thalassospira povalilytica TaxID=732237 RepID=UPI001D1886B6|nr:DUF2256 domain-containing protein [Thalassospira povalilytica]MCC4240932.1 DUF2256 domain-containing protein [Thalassospira povalilytica]
MPRNANGSFRTKAHLPSKTCLSCGRPFSWRRKWKTCWEGVKYCSDRCRNSRPHKRSPEHDGVGS